MKIDGGFRPTDCTPNAQTSGAEICNGQDDDCDGLFDEGPSGIALKQACTSECGGGIQECFNGAWSDCTAPTPSMEVCDGADNDCDDMVDEDCDCVHGETRPCGIDTGACRAGVEQCIDGVWNETCFGEVGPVDEICNNGIDDNCDNQIDEGCQCMPGETQICGSDVGSCQAGTLTCGMDSRWGTSCEGEITPVAEICNGADNNCDGEVDRNVATGFGWGADPSEGNDTCQRATNIPDAVDSAGWTSVPVNDPSDIEDFPTLYPPGEVDWYSFRAEEVSHGACVPTTSQCAYVLTLQLELSVQSDPADYEVCFATTNDCAMINDTNLFCSDMNDWREEFNSFLFAVKWGGSCGFDDSRDVRVVVRNTSGASACEYYQLHANFAYDSEEECP